MPKLNDMPLMADDEGNIVLFYPNIPETAKAAVSEVLSTRWIGQGPKVDFFEKQFLDKFHGSYALAVNSGTSALHLAYELIGIGEGDEVIVPLFTCTATNIPLLHLNAKPVFVDIEDDSLNMDASKIAENITEKTKAIVIVHYGGRPVDLDAIRDICSQYNLPLVQDCAHGLGMIYDNKPINECSEYTMYSFQAIKTITTGDGGMLVIHGKGKDKYQEGKRRRWFGIDREKKQGGVWENDIVEAGHKFQMTDISAAIGIEQLKYFDEYHSHRIKLLAMYESELKGIHGLSNISGSVHDERYRHGAWLCTVKVENRLDLQKKLYAQGIETNQVHYRNDRYSIFSRYAKQREYYENMNEIEDKYLVLPLHNKLNELHIEKICSAIKDGW